MRKIKMLWCAAVTALAMSPMGIANGTAITDGSFETQGAASGIGDFCYGASCANGAWSFAPLVAGSVGDGLISQNGSAWGQPISGANGTYFAFVQQNGLFSQTFMATQTSTEVLSWIDATRSNFGGPNTYTVSDDPGLLRRRLCSLSSSEPRAGVASGLIHLPNF
jgi:hypothetical protein